MTAPNADKLASSLTSDAEGYLWPGIFNWHLACLACPSIKSDLNLPRPLIAAKVRFRGIATSPTKSDKGRKRTSDCRGSIQARLSAVSL